MKHVRLPPQAVQVGRGRNAGPRQESEPNPPQFSDLKPALLSGIGSLYGGNGYEPIPVKLTLFTAKTQHK